MIIVVPLSPNLLDVLLIINISFSLIILLTTLFVKEALDFSTFPTLLLIVTLFRLSLNISSTRLILSEGGKAGQVIETFGNFVVRGEVIVGLIIFLIIVVIQFIVITKGSERVTEVAARFTLDSMPGKQMSIDADLNAGLINEKEAKERRLKIERQADFYGSMDGASKFVKGDAIAGIIITLINLVGGIIIGSTTEGMEFSQVIQIYSLATVGDGLVSQIPALLISTATGIIATRSASDTDLNVQATKQLFSQYRVLFIGGVSLILLSFVPGLPKFFLISLGSILLILGYNLYRKSKKDESISEEVEELPIAEKPKADIMDLLHVDPIKIEIGYSLIPLIDDAQGGDLLERMITIRQQFASDLGLILPVVRFRDNLTLKSSEYTIVIRGAEVEKGEVLVDHFLAMNSLATDDDGLDGIETTDPAYGMKAKWISKELQEKAEMLGYTVINPSSVIATHISKVIKKYSFEVLGRQDVQKLIDNLKENQPVLIEEVIGKTISVGLLQKVLIGLLKEGIPIRALDRIIETLGDYGKSTKDVNVLIEYARQTLKREITQIYSQDGKIDVITVNQSIEEIISKSIRSTDGGNFLALDPNKIKEIIKAISDAIKKANELGIDVVILTSPVVRIYLKEITMQIDERIDVISYNEIENSVQIQVVGSINI